jgi:hypothetical protein
MDRLGEHTPVRAIIRLQLNRDHHLRDNKKKARGSGLLKLVAGPGFESVK